MGWKDSIRLIIVKDPVIAASCLIAGIGLTLPIVVPPIRSALYSPKPVERPKISDVVSGMTGKQ